MEPTGVSGEAERFGSDCKGWVDTPRAGGCVDGEGGRQLSRSVLLNVYAAIPADSVAIPTVWRRQEADF